MAKLRLHHRKVHSGMGIFQNLCQLIFFSSYPCVLTQCEVEGGYALQLILNVDASNQSELVGWFYTSISRMLNPYLHLFCIGV